MQCLTALAAFGILLVSAPARAQNAERVELAWHAPAGCPREDEVRARIRKLAGASSTEGSWLRAEATVTRNPDGRYHLKLVVHTEDATGERHIEGKSCEDLAGAAAVNLVLLLDASQPAAAGSAAPARRGDAGQPGAASAGSAGDPQPPAAEAADVAAPQPEESRASTPAEPTAQSSRRSWRFVLRVPLASLGLGPLPQPSFGLALGAGVRVGGWTFVAEGAVWLPQTLTAPDRAGVSAEVDHIDAGLRTCRAFPWGSFELAPCALVSLRHVWARGSGAHVTARTAASSWVALGAGLQLRLPLAEWLGLLASIDAQLETAQPRISIDGVGEVDQLTPASVTFALGTEWTL